MTNVDILTLHAMRVSGIRDACNVCGDSLPIDDEPLHKCMGQKWHLWCGEHEMYWGDSYDTPCPECGHVIYKKDPRDGLK